MYLSQAMLGSGLAVIVREGSEARITLGAPSVYSLAQEAVTGGRILAPAAAERMRLPFRHPDPAYAFDSTTLPVAGDIRTASDARLEVEAAPFGLRPENPPSAAPDDGVAWMRAL